VSESSFQQRLSGIGDQLEAATGARITRRRRRRNAGIAGLATLLIVATATATQLGPNDTESAAAKVLDRAALAGPPKLKQGQYLYTRTLVVSVTKRPTSTGPFVTTTRQSNELWAGANGAGLAIEHPPERTFKQPPAPPSEGGTAGSPAAGSQPAYLKEPTPKTKISRYKRGTISSSELGSVDVAFRGRLLATYGLDADRLVRLSFDQEAFDQAMLASATRVNKQIGGVANEQVAINRQAFTMVAAMLGQWGEPMPKTLRNALYQFASTIDGVTVAKTSSAVTGKQVIELSLGDASILFDPDSYRLAGTNYRSGDTETTIQAVRSKIVNELPKPKAGQ
jgi:hypothetical protein